VRKTGLITGVTIGLIFIAICTTVSEIGYKVPNILTVTY